MQIGDMYPAVLALILVAILIAVGVTVLGNLAASSGITKTGAEAVNDSIDAIVGFVTWLSIIVLVIAAAIIIGLVVRSFSGNPGQ